MTTLHNTSIAYYIKNIHTCIISVLSAINSKMSLAIPIFSNKWQIRRTTFLER